MEIVKVVLPSSDKKYNKLTKLALGGENEN